MAVNKVVINTENGAETIVDLTGDSVNPAALAQGYTAHDSSGKAIEGTMPTSTVLYTEQSLSEGQKSQARDNIGAVGEELIPFVIDTTLAEANTIISAEVAKKMQLEPAFANSVAECTDISKMYVLPDGFIYAYTRVAVEKYTNALEMATDATGNSLYNGKGYKNGVRLTDIVVSSNPNGESTNANYMSTGFIKYQLYNDTSVKYPSIYVKGLAWTNVSDTRMRWYRKLSTATSYSDVYGNMSISGSKLTDNGLYKIEKKVGESWVETTSADTGTYWRITPDGEAMAAALKAYHPGYNLGELDRFRFSLAGKGENLIISIGEPIETIEQYGWNNTGRAFVPADNEDRIVALEAKVAKLETIIQSLA